jgi:arylsulfatase A-like enzyme
VAAIGAAALFHGVSGRHPNLVVISIDTLRATSLRAFSAGAAKLPNLEAFASRSVRCSHAHTTAPWTLPAHASLLTGLYPDRHGATHTDLRIASPEPTLAETLRAAGFENVAFTDGGYLDQGFGFDRGFHTYDEGGTLGGDRYPRRKGGGVDAFRRARAFLAERSSDAPLFLFLHTFVLHDYFKSGAVRRGFALKCLLGQRACSTETWQQLESMYAARLTRLDRDFGMLMEALDRLAADAPTLVVLVSDHGEGFDHRRGRIHHAGRLHSDQLRVPVLLHGPDLVPGELESPVSLVDIMPTALEILGVEGVDGLDGRSLVSAIRGEPLPPRQLFAMDHQFSWNAGARRTESTPRSDPWSIAVIDGESWYIDGPQGEELYDTARDPGLTAPLAINGVGVALRSIAAERRMANRGHGDPRPIDPKLKEDLRALGYVE